MIQAKQYNSRGELEKAVISTHGRTTDKKDDTIGGTVAELEKFYLRHGQMMWGVRVVASDYQVSEPTVTINRGQIHLSKIDGKVISIKKK